MPRIKKPEVYDSKRWSKTPKNEEWPKWSSVFEATEMATDDAIDDMPENNSVIEDEENNTANSAIKMKLTQFCKNENLRKKLDSIVLIMNQLVAEAYVFANFHVMRLLNREDTLPIVASRDFYYRCLLATSKNNCRNGTLGQEIEESKTAFDMLRSHGEKIDIRPYNQIVASLSITMATMASNHLIMNLSGRLQKFLKWKYPEIKKFHKHICSAVVDFPQKSIDSFFTKFPSSEKVDKAKEIGMLLRNEGGLKYKPKFTTKAHLTLPLYYKFLKETEEKNTKLIAIEGKQKLKMFTLLPIKAGFTISNIPISSMAFMAILKNMNLVKFTGDGRLENHRQYWSKILQHTRF